jgi:hypothetical protein
MDAVAVRLAKLKREAEKEWRKKWRQKLRKAAPANAAEWRALGGAAVGALLQVLLIIALPFLVLVRGSVFFYENGTRSGRCLRPVSRPAVITAYAVWIAKKLMRRGVRGGAR